MKFSRKQRLVLALTIFSGLGFLALAFVPAFSKYIAQLFSLCMISFGISFLELAIFGLASGMVPVSQTGYMVTASKNPKMHGVAVLIWLLFGIFVITFGVICWFTPFQFKA